MGLGAEWVWAPKAQPDHLLNACAVQGIAVTPGKWAGGHKSKRHSSMIECGYILLDWDEGMSWEEWGKMMKEKNSTGSAGIFFEAIDKG